MKRNMVYYIVKNTRVEGRLDVILNFRSSVAGIKITQSR